MSTESHPGADEPSAIVEMEEEMSPSLSSEALARRGQPQWQEGGDGASEGYEPWSFHVRREREERIARPKPLTLEKRKQQREPYDEYRTFDACNSDEWEYQRVNDGVARAEKRCSSLSPNACPDLADALEGSQWHAQKPGVVCSYSVDSIKTGKQLRDYVRHWGYDEDFNDVIMPRLMYRDAPFPPKGLNGPYHKRCSAFLSTDELGEQMRRWATRHPKLSDALIEEYCYATGGSDCDYVLRNQRPLYWYMSKHPLLKNATPDEWYVPARNPSIYLQPSSVRNHKPPLMSKKLKAKVRKAANDLASVSDTPEETKKDLERICACRLSWWGIPAQRKRWFAGYLRRHPHEYFARRVSQRSPDVVSGPALTGAEPTVRPEKVKNIERPAEIEEYTASEEPARERRKGAMKKPGTRSVGIRSNTTTLVGIIVAFVVVAIVAVVVIYFIYRSQAEKEMPVRRRQRPYEFGDTSYRDEGPAETYIV